MLVCYARELKEGFAAYTEDVVKIMVSHLKFYFHDGEWQFCDDMHPVWVQGCKNRPSPFSGWMPNLLMKPGCSS